MPIKVPARDIGLLVFAFVALAAFALVLWFDLTHPGVQFPLSIRIPMSEFLLVLFLAANSLFWLQLIKDSRHGQ